jgi:hypothetical protein
VDNDEATTTMATTTPDQVPELPATAVNVTTPARPRRQQPEDTGVDYVVEAVLDVRGQGRGREFLLKFEGWQAPEWTREVHCAGCRDLIKEFWHDRGDAPGMYRKRRRRTRI